MDEKVTFHRKEVVINLIIASAIIDGNEKWGILDGSDDILVPFVYDEMDYVQDNLFVVKRDGYYGVIDVKGDSVIPCNYDEKAYLIGWVKYGRFDTDKNTEVKRNGMLGFINSKGIEVYPCKYETVKYVETGWFETSYLLYVKEDGHLGIIDTNRGIELIPCEYRRLEYLKNNLIIAVKMDYSYGIYNNKGDVVVPFGFYDEIGSYHRKNSKYYKYYFNKGGLCRVYKNEKFGFINAKGAEIIPCQYDKVEEDRNLIFVIKDGLKGIFSLDGNVIAPCIYESLDFYFYGLIKAKKEGLYGLMDYKGEVMLSCQYDNIDSRIKNLFGYNLLVVSKGGLKGLIDFNAHEIVPCLYDNIDTPNNSLCIVVKEGLFGIINIKGDEIVPCEYERIELWYQDGTYKVKKGGLYGILNERAVLITPCIYSEIINCTPLHSFIKGQGYKAKRDDSYFLIDKWGKEIKSISEKRYNEEEKDDEGWFRSWGEGQSYGRYAGTYAQDEMGYSDDDIDTIFDGEPDAYWNID